MISAELTYSSQLLDHVVLLVQNMVEQDQQESELLKGYQ